MSVVGHQPQAIKHFNLRRKPKAAALRADLLNKSVETANKLKTHGGGGSSAPFPMRKSTMPRKMSDSTPLKGLPSRTLGSTGFRNPRVALPNRNPNKKEGGVKLLDITEQPIGQAAMKKRKRQQEMEDAKKFAEEAKNTEAKNTTTNEANNMSAKAAQAAKETPDYAAGLSTINPPTPAPPPAYAPPTPAYAPPTPSMPISAAAVPTLVSIGKKFNSRNKLNFRWYVFKVI